MLTNRLIVANKSCLDALQNHSNGEMVYLEDEKEIWIWSDEENGWVRFEAQQNGFELNLYDLNKSIIEQMTPMTLDDISLKSEMLNAYQEATENTYHMLLCRDFNYYTLFSYSVMPTFENFAQAVITIITELGDVYSIERTEDGVAIEIWIKPEGEESPYAFYLFPYDTGVVYHG